MIDTNIRGSGDTVEVEKTNAVIYDPDGNIKGINEMCPHCKKYKVFINDTVHFYHIWSVGAVKQWECNQCRKRFHTLTLAVPPGMTPEEFYQQIQLQCDDKINVSKNTQRSVVCGDY